MALNWDKSDIEVKNGDAIKHNQIFCDFMQWTFNCLDELYLREILLLIDAIMKYQLRKQSAAKTEILNRETNTETKEWKVHLILLQKKPVLWVRQPKQFEQQVTPPIQILMRISHIGVKQALDKTNILEWVSVGEKVMLII